MLVIGANLILPFAIRDFSRSSIYIGYNVAGEDNTIILARACVCVLRVHTWADCERGLVVRVCDPSHALVYIPIYIYMRLRPHVCTYMQPLEKRPRARALATAKI